MFRTRRARTADEVQIVVRYERTSANGYKSTNTTAIVVGFFFFKFIRPVVVSCSLILRGWRTPVVGGTVNKRTYIELTIVVLIDRDV